MNAYFQTDTPTPTPTDTPTPTVTPTVVPVGDAVQFVARPDDYNLLPVLGAVAVIALAGYWLRGMTKGGDNG